MANDNPEPTGSDEHRINVSDWISFLAGEKHEAMSTIVSFGMLLTALITIILLTRGETVLSTIVSAIAALVLLGFVYSMVFRPFQERGRLAGDLLDRVMCGELEDERLIRQEWYDGVATLKRRRRRAAMQGKR